MGRLLKTVGMLWFPGFLGVLVFLWTALPLLERRIASFPQAPPLEVVIALQAAQLGIVLLVLVWLGALCAPRLGLRSHLVESWIHRKPFPVRRAEKHWTVALGVVVPIVILGLDAIWRPLLPLSLQASAQENTWQTLLAGLLYGGITEELMLRWGVMAVIAWLLRQVLRLVQRSKGPKVPGAGVMWAAIAIAALLFGLGHLPATAAMVGLTPFLIVRALLLNGIAALAFGWLFWRFSLEAAIVAHMLFHVMSFSVSALI